MKKEDFIKKLDEKEKLIRIEYDYTQDKMAEMLGISKKTLIQIEKGRQSMGWTTGVALCALFRESEVLDMTFGGDAYEIILALAHERSFNEYPKTLGGKVWWNNVELYGKYKIQQNIMSRHYRILDEENRRIYFSFDYNSIKDILEKL